MLFLEKIEFFIGINHDEKPDKGCQHNSNENSCRFKQDTHSRMQPQKFIKGQSNRQHESKQQDFDERVLEFLQELLPQGFTQRLGQYIVTMFTATGNHLFVGQSYMMFLFGHLSVLQFLLDYLDSLVSLEHLEMLAPKAYLSRRLKRFLLKRESQRSLITPNSASKKMLLFILLSP